MKWFIASDIHGSAYYAKLMLDAFVRENADRMLLLGDILYHGPRNDLPLDYSPKTVISLLSPFSDLILSVRGNCDGEVDDMVLPFPVLAEYALIADETMRGNIIFATHGHHYNRDSLPSIKKGDVLLHGHTHIPTFDCVQGVYIINPGSVSIPKDNSKHSYMIFEGGVFTLKDLDGNIIFSKSV